MTAGSPGGLQRPKQCAWGGAAGDPRLRDKAQRGPGARSRGREGGRGPRPPCRSPPTPHRPRSRGDKGPETLPPPMSPSPPSPGRSHCPSVLVFRSFSLCFLPPPLSSVPQSSSPVLPSVCHPLPPCLPSPVSPFCLCPPPLSLFPGSLCPPPFTLLRLLCGCPPSMSPFTISLRLLDPRISSLLFPHLPHPLVSSSYTIHPFLHLAASFLLPIPRSPCPRTDCFLSPYILHRSIPLCSWKGESGRAATV